MWVFIIIQIINGFPVDKKEVKGGFDSLNVRFIGNWPFGHSYAVSFDPSRNLVFLGSGGGVYILNVSNPSNPQKVSEKIHTRGIVYGLFYESVNKRLYIAAGQGGLEIWDVTDASNPIKLGHYFTPGLAYGVYVSGNYAYVADDSAGLRIINISNPSSPYEAGYYVTPGEAMGVYVSGNYAYVADVDAGLQIYEFYGVGIKEKDFSKEGFRLLNNIVKNEIKIELSPLIKDKIIQFELYNVLGERVRSYMVSKLSSKISLSTCGICPGIYFLKYNKEEKILKVIVNR
ncbi:MAG: hypothetical protein ABIN15_03605 [candidate division WOR-3 bacterium]